MSSIVRNLPFDQEATTEALAKNHLGKIGQPHLLYATK